MFGEKYVKKYSWGRMKLGWIKRQANKISRTLSGWPSLALFHGGHFNTIKKLIQVFFYNGYSGLVFHIKYYVGSTQQKIQTNNQIQNENSKILWNKAPGYIIVSPNFQENSAGIRALFILYNDLRELGFQTFITGPSENHDNSIQILSTIEARAFINRGYAVVYPETVTGNPLKAKTVIRFVGNKPGLLGGEKVYSESELVFYYSDAYREAIKNKVSGKLYIPTIDERIFYFRETPTKARMLNCFYVGKSNYKDGYFKKEETFEISRSSPPRSELGKLLRVTDILYCFDNSTAFAYEAALCGCRVVIIPDGTAKKQDYEKYELGREGIAWGPNELDLATNNHHAIRKKYEAAKVDYQKQLQEFIKITQARMSSSHT